MTEFPSPVKRVEIVEQIVTHMMTSFRCEFGVVATAYRLDNVPVATAYLHREVETSYDEVFGPAMRETP